MVLHPVPAPGTVSGVHGATYHERRRSDQELPPLRVAADVRLEPILLLPMGSKPGAVGHRRGWNCPAADPFGTPEADLNDTNG